MKKLLGVVVLLSLVLGNFYLAKAQQGSSYPPVLVQAASVVTDASGNWSITWSQSFTNPNPFITARAIVPTSNNPINCEVSSRNATSVTGWCRQSAPTLLNLSIITTGLTLNPFGNVPATGTTVMVAGRDLTQ